MMNCVCNQLPPLASWFVTHTSVTVRIGSLLRLVGRCYMYSEPHLVNGCRPVSFVRKLVKCFEIARGLKKKVTMPKYHRMEYSVAIYAFTIHNYVQIHTMLHVVTLAFWGAFLCSTEHAHYNCLCILLKKY